MHKAMKLPQFAFHVEVLRVEITFNIGANECENQVSSCDFFERRNDSPPLAFFYRRSWRWSNEILAPIELLII